MHQSVEEELRMVRAQLIATEAMLEREEKARQKAEEKAKYEYDMHKADLHFFKLETDGMEKEMKEAKEKAELLELDLEVETDHVDWLKGELEQAGGKVVELERKFRDCKRKLDDMEIEMEKDREWYGYELSKAWSELHRNVRRRR
jgi:chromosome segregation ATPase